MDASVVVKWFVNEEGSDSARLLRDVTQEMFAPRLMALEVGNAFRNKARKGELSPLEAESFASNIAELAINWTEDEALVVDAVRLALALDHPVYDCVYLALAQRLGGTVITSDIRFLNAVVNSEHRDTVMALDAFATA